MTNVNRPDAAQPSGPQWWIRPAVLSVLNIAIVLVAVTLVVGWSAPVIVAVIIAFGLGAWWFLNQRPTRQ